MGISEFFHTLQTLFYLMTSVAMVWAFKVFVIDKLRKRFSKGAWENKLPDIVKRIENDVDLLRREQYTLDKRVGLMEDISKSREEQMASIDVRLNLLVKGVLALLSDDSERKQKVEGELFDNLKF